MLKGGSRSSLTPFTNESLLFMAKQNIQIETFRLIGIALPQKTTNKGGQSNIDCGNLWQQFEKEDCYSKIPGRVDDAVYAVYHSYEGDHLQPFSYFIGCKVEEETEIPDGMESLTVLGGTFHKVVAKGEMPGCIAGAWKGIWDSKLNRRYAADFEVYDERSQDWSDAEVDIFLSVHH